MDRYFGIAGRTVVWIFPAVMFVVALSPAVLLQGLAADWPQWRGPARDGVWSEQGIVERFPAAGLPVCWRAKLGPGYSGPAVAGGRVFVLDRIPSEPAAPVTVAWNVRNKSADQERVLCLDEKTGAVLWTHVYPCDYSCAYGIGPRATATVSGEFVYTTGAMGDMFCLEVATGKVVWQKNFVKDFGAQVPLYGFAAQPLVDGERVVTMVGGQGRTVVAFDRRTGREIWKAISASEPGYCAPIVGTFGGRRQLVVWHGDGLAGLDPETGLELWTVPVGNKVGMAVASPAVDGDRLTISGQYSGSYMFEFKAGQQVPAVLWKARPVDVPEKEGRKAGFNSTLSPILFFGGHVYGPSLYGEFCCLNGETGDRVWATLKPTSGGDKPRERWSSIFPVRNGERVFLFNEKGDLIIAKLSPAGYEELDRAHLLDPDMPASGSGGRKVIWSHPAFANRRIYVRNNSELICVSLAASK